jgi:hypothetical protein
MLSLSDLVGRYLRLRAVAMKLNTVLLKQLPKDALDEGGRELGFLRKGVFVFDSEDESTILMDYCLYNVLRQGRNTIQTFLARNPPPEGSDESLVLQGMSKAWYSLCSVVEVEPGAGVRVQDIFRQAEHLLIDIGLSRSAVPGALMATRVIPLDGFLMTTGAGLPLGGGSARREKLIGQVTNVIFANNIASIRYRGPEEQEYQPHEGHSQRQRLVPVQTVGRVGRNERCPCGSGKKFRKCCAKD